MPPRSAGRATLVAAGERGAARRNRRARSAVAGEEKSGRCWGLSRPPPRDRGGPSVAATAWLSRRRALPLCRGRERRFNRGRRVRAQPPGRVHLRRRHTRTAGRKSRLLHIVALRPRHWTRITSHCGCPPADESSPPRRALRQQGRPSA